MSHHVICENPHEKTVCNQKAKYSLISVSDIRTTAYLVSNDLNYKRNGPYHYSLLPTDTFRLHKYASCTVAASLFIKVVTVLLLSPHSPSYYSTIHICSYTVMLELPMTSMRVLYWSIPTSRIYMQRAHGPFQCYQPFSFLEILLPEEPSLPFTLHVRAFVFVQCMWLQPWSWCWYCLTINLGH